MNTTAYKGRRAGAQNYKKTLLLDIIERILPTSTMQWAQVAQQYQVESKEDNIRVEKDLKNYFIKKLCNDFYKPTGQASPDPETAI